MNEDKLKIAVFIDFDNIQIGVRSTLSRDFDLALVLEALKERGEVVTKIAYGNWKRAGELTRTLTQNAVLMVQRDLTPRGDKNGADINLALDALEMAINHSHINAFVIVGGDSDFIALVEKLKQYNKAVFVVGGRSFTSSVLQRNCREFLAYENLVDTAASPADRKRDDGARRREVFPLSRAVALVDRGLKVLADREVQAQLGLLKSTLIQLDSTFNERDFGASSFRAFIQKMADAQLVSVRQQGNSYVVEPLDREPLDGSTEAGAQAPPEAETESSETRAEAESGDGRAEADASYSPSYSTDYSNGAETESAPAATEPAIATNERTAPYAPPAPPTATRPPEEALDLLQRVLTPLRGTNPRPLYLRNVKQLLRAESPSFDEQQYGFASIVDLLRAGQNQNWLRLQRDRRGALRVFIPPSPAAPGSSEAAESAAAGEAATPPSDTDSAASEVRDAAPAAPSPIPLLEGADERQPVPPVLAAPPKRREEGDEDSQIAILGYYSGIHGEKTEEAELSLAAAVADSGGRKKRGPRKPKPEGGAAPRRRKPAPKR